MCWKFTVVIFVCATDRRAFLVLNDSVDAERGKPASSADAMRRSSACASCRAHTESNSLLRAENNLLRTKFEILLDKVSVHEIPHFIVNFYHD